MKRNHAVPLALLLVLVLAAAVVLPNSLAANGAAVRSAEQCYTDTEAAVFYVRGWDANGTVASTGSGFVITKQGLAITAAHVVKGMARVTVVLGEKELETQVLTCNLETDAATLLLPAGQYPCLAVATAAPKDGGVVRAMGYPMRETLLITEGIVNSAQGVISGKTRMLVSCALVNGMSGGPVLDAYGKVVGLCSGSVRTMSGIHLSVLTDALRGEIAQAKEVMK